MEQLTTITLLLLLAGTSTAKYLPSSTLDLVEPASGDISCFKRSFTSFSVIRPNGESYRGNENWLMFMISDKNNKVLASVINHDSAKLGLKAKNSWKQLVSI
jgi:hypothetical protein